MYEKQASFYTYRIISCRPHYRHFGGSGLTAISNSGGERAILTAEQVYHMSTGQTTGNLADLDIDMPSGSSGNTFTIKNTTYSFDSANTSFIARRTYKSQTYVLQANFAGSTDDVPSWEIVCAAPTGNNICQVLGFSSTPYTTGGYGKYYRKE